MSDDKLSDLAPLMRDTLLAWEASINATTREETERLYIKAAHMRKRVLAALKDLPGGGGAVEKPGITPLPAAAGSLTTTEACDEFNERQKLRFDIGMSKLGVPIKAQDGSPHDKAEIVSGIIDGFAQPLPNLDHLIDRRVPPPLVGWQEIKEFLDNMSIKGDTAGSETQIALVPSIDDDLDDVPLGKACSLDGDSCESCQ